MAFSWFIAHLVIFKRACVLNPTLLVPGYLCIPISVLELCSEARLSHLQTAWSFWVLLLRCVRRDWSNAQFRDDIPLHRGKSVPNALPSVLWIQPSWWEQAPAWPCPSTGYYSLVLLGGPFLRHMSWSVHSRVFEGDLLQVSLHSSAPFFCHAPWQPWSPGAGLRVSLQAVCSAYTCFSPQVVSCGYCKAHLTPFLPTKDNWYLVSWKSSFPIFCPLSRFKRKGVFSPCDWFHIDRKQKSRICVLVGVWM